MRDTTRQQFQRLFEGHDREVFKSSLRSARTEFGPEPFDQVYARVRDEVIHPLMTELHELMHGHGLKSQIVVQDRKIDSDARPQPAKITFEYLVLTDAEAEGLPVTTPVLEFTAQPEAGQIMVYENSALPFVGGHIGVIGQYRPGEMTSDVVEKYLLETTARVLRGTGVS